MSIDIFKILEEIKILPKWDEQICLQSVKDNNDPFLGISFVKNIEKKGYKESDFT